MSRGFERPPAWGVALLVAVLVALGVVLPLLALRQGRSEDPMSAATARRLTARDAAAQASQSAAAKAREDAITKILVVGDSYTAGSDEGGNGPNSWAELLDKDMDATRLVRVDEVASGGSGYVEPGPKRITFGQLLATAPAYDYRLVIFFGSRNDNLQPVTAVQSAAATAYADALHRYPNAKLLVIGPAWSGDNPPTVAQRNRDAVRAAAIAAGATFADPVAAGWFTGSAASLIGRDGVQPTDAGHRYMEGLIRPLVEQVLTSGTQ